MLQDWNVLPDDMQIHLTQQALLRASETIAQQAELLAHEMDLGHLRDHGGAEALRLLAAVVRVTGCDQTATPHPALTGRMAGHA